MNSNLQIENQQTIDSTDMNEQDILKRIAEGEKNLYALIMRKYNQRLYRIALSIISNESEVDDLMQAAYIKAYENLGQFRSQSLFSTWITRILINECLMFRRKKQQTSKAWSEISNSQPGRSPIVQTPLMNVMNSELKIILEQSIRSLPGKYRTVFIMRELENMSVSETIDCLGISEANVKVRLNRAKVMLRDKLKEYVKEDEPLQFYKPRCNKVVDYVMERIKATEIEESTF